MSVRKVARVGAIVGVVIGLSIVPLVSGPSQAQQEQSYLALGDSIAAGLSSSRPAERGYPAILRELMQAERSSTEGPGTVQLENLAVPGETAQSFIDEGQLVEALDRIDSAGNDGARTITLTLGGNDMLSLWDMSDAEREAGLQRFSESFQQIIDEISTALEESETDVFVTTYYDLTEGNPQAEGSDSWWLARFNEVIASTAREVGFSIVDLEAVFRGEISELTWFPADIHPNNAGHEAIAEAIWRETAYDDEGPEIEITRPDEEQTRSRTPTIHATVEDNVEVESVELQIDGERVSELLYISERDAWVGLWDARDYTESEAEITVVATDLAGNESNDSVSVSLPPR